MNTPQQQAELYRKAAETIEMCAKHGIEPMVKFKGVIDELSGCSLKGNLADYDFPITVIEGHLVWADTVVYNKDGVRVRADEMDSCFEPYTIFPPKRTVIVELLVEDAEWIADVWGGIVNCSTKRIEKATKEALDNLKS